MADLAVLEQARRGLDRHYTGVSPQLLARVRANWSAQGLDLDAIWRDTIQRMPGYAELDHLPDFPDSRPVDLLLLFDQGCCWVDTLRHVALMLRGPAAPARAPADPARPPDADAGRPAAPADAGRPAAAADAGRPAAAADAGRPAAPADAGRPAAPADAARTPSDPWRLTADQVAGLVAITTRLRDELAAVRMLAIAGLAMPAMQIARSISEDVDLALALLVRRKLAAGFVACRSPEDAAEFWRRHLAGGRAFRLVAQALYRYGLDYSDDSDYVRWRKEVLVFLGSAVHTSFNGTAAVERAGGGDGLNPTAQECLYFATIRVQEMCAYSLVLGADLRHDLGLLRPGPGMPTMRLRFATHAGEIIVDQMRWLTNTRDPRAPTPRPPLH